MSMVANKQLHFPSYLLEQFRKRSDRVCNSGWAAVDIDH